MMMRKNHTTEEKHLIPCNKHLFDHKFEERVPIRFKRMLLMNTTVNRFNIGDELDLIRLFVYFHCSLLMNMKLGFIFGQQYYIQNRKRSMDVIL